MAERIDSTLKTVGSVKGWVTIGDYSAIDPAKMSNVITAFVVFDDLGTRPRGFTLPGVTREIQSKFRAVSNAQFSVLPPSPVPGLGVHQGLW